MVYRAEPPYTDVYLGFDERLTTEKMLSLPWRLHTTSDVSSGHWLCDAADKNHVSSGPLLVQFLRCCFLA